MERSVKTNSIFVFICFENFELMHSEMSPSGWHSTFRHHVQARRTGTCTPRSTALGAGTSTFQATASWQHVQSYQSHRLPAHLPEDCRTRGSTSRSQGHIHDHAMRTMQTYSNHQRSVCWRKDFCPQSEAVKTISPHYALQPSLFTAVKSWANIRPLLACLHL